MSQSPHPRQTQRSSQRRSRLGPLACLTAILLAGVAVVVLNTQRAPSTDVYLYTGKPTPSADQVFAAPEAVAETAVEKDSGRSPLAPVARPSTKVVGEAPPRPTATAARRSQPPPSIDGGGSELAAGTSVDTAAGAGREHQAAQDGPPVRGLETAAIRLTNKERTRRGCPALRVDSRLTRSARAHSRDMAAKNYFGHTSPQGTTPWQRMSRAGYSNSAAENIARGYQSAEETLRGWMASPGHRRNILNCQITTVGVGVAHGSGDIWWTQDFGYS
ncbi:CAP domain-containing protein [Sphaerisporangium sp. TRM90804]|uniref:CAP domain-containing protein n=1 Tax=Sphaerisporangium sp. TRM90804 TaxID=3031113 RepID=UPI00244D3758|nr:CAP domain-containing protein [Sphaerisporangium sp. TRM90804]MDH2423826.1 CAP domain-containing protein [Sphaerisporangium sp. TRM90804]